jgi:hypothetical protein
LVLLAIQSVVIESKTGSPDPGFAPRSRGFLVVHDSDGILRLRAECDGECRAPQHIAYSRTVMWRQQGRSLSGVAP